MTTILCLAATSETPATTSPPASEKEPEHRPLSRLVQDDSHELIRRLLNTTSVLFV